MPSLRVSKGENNQMYFITCTTLHWYYIFDRHNRFKILSDSLNYCVQHKNLKIFAYVLMLNHIHLIVQSPDVSGFLRDFKKHTARELMENMQKTEPKVAELFQKPDGKYQIWQKTNLPLMIETEKFFAQKKQYIEHNPVKKEYITHPEYWQYSSANPYSPVNITSLHE